MNTDITTSIIIPAYNEEQAIESSLYELMEYIDKEHTEIIVINDGSTDQTAEIVSRISGVTLINHKRNHGYGSAIKTGCKQSHGQIIAWYDADGQARPQDLIAIIDQLKNRPYDYCIGVRSRESHVEKSRVFGKMVLGAIFKFISREPAGDFNSGLRAFRKNVLLKYLPLLPERFGASTVTTLLMTEEGYLGCEIPIISRQRIGKSTVRQFRDGIYTLKLIFNIVLLFRPMQVFGNIGFFSILFGLSYGLYRALWDGIGFPVLSAIIVIFGLQSLLFGLISEQISRLRRECLEYHS